jgi:tetratricopeptide (TPR) repeat protein
LTRNLNINLSRFYQEIKNESFIKGQIAYDQLEFEIAADHFLEHIDEYPGDGIAWFRLGNCLNQLGRRSLDKELLDNALNCFNTSISLDSNYYHAWGQAALIYSVTGRIDLAKYCAGKAYEIEPNVSFTNYVIGKVANEAKQYELAVTFLMAAINLADDFDKKNFTHQWYLEKAIANAWLKRDYDAEKDYKICLALNSNNLDALFWYGNFLGIRKRTAEACEQFKNLKILSPYYKMSGYSVDQMIQNNRCR